MHAVYCLFSYLSSGLRHLIHLPKDLGEVEYLWNMDAIRPLTVIACFSLSPLWAKPPATAFERVKPLNGLALSPLDLSENPHDFEEAKKRVRQRHGED